MSDEKEREFHRERRFLNPHEGMAAIQSRVVVKETEHFVEFDTCLDISDCSRTCQLDFSVYELDELDDKRTKAHNLRRAINRYVDALEAAYDFWEKRKIARDKASKKA
jgi:hypothetical protein